jgi:LmbE family N-acetylglucosaminyl deacetylase
MRAIVRASFLVMTLALALAGALFAQAPQRVNPEDDRYKVDIMVVVAHPDDEAFFTPYLARAIYDMHKRVAVVFSTHGGSGVNRFTRERGPAMANEREIEARDACARLGIKNVWFLDGKDTPSQNVMNSLSNWGHGTNLERLVGLVRLTRPDVIFTHFPGVFIGENHGDHQATGVLVIEAFDMAADPMVFPAQLSGDMSHYESYLSNLQTWQPKKIYFGSDANDSKQFDGSGPTYSVKEISPSQKKPYWRLALDSAMAHRTQFPDQIDRLTKMSDAELEKEMNDPDSSWWSEPLTLIFGKSYYASKPTDDVFSHLDSGENGLELYIEGQNPPGSAILDVKLGGPWFFYEKFRKAYHLENIRVADPAEIGIKSGTVLSVPLTVLHSRKNTMEIEIKAEVPQGWKISSGTGKFMLPAEKATNLRVEIQTPLLSDAEFKNAAAQPVKIKVSGDGLAEKTLQLNVQLRSHALPQ